MPFVAGAGTTGLKRCHLYQPGLEIRSGATTDPDLVQEILLIMPETTVEQAQAALAAIDFYSTFSDRLKGYSTVDCAIEYLLDQQSPRALQEDDAESTIPRKQYECYLSDEKSNILRKQVEYYLSDENLQRDKFFHGKISADPHGWLDMRLITKCNKMQAMKASIWVVLKALTGSMLETKVDGNYVAVRRPPSMPLPELKEDSTLQQKQGETSSCNAKFRILKRGETLASDTNTPAPPGTWKPKSSFAQCALPKTTPKPTAEERAMNGVVICAQRTPLKSSAPCFQPSLVTKEEESPALVSNPNPKDPAETVDEQGVALEIYRGKTRKPSPRKQLQIACKDVLAGNEMIMARVPASVPFPECANSMLEISEKESIAGAAEKEFVKAISYSPGVSLKLVIENEKASMPMDSMSTGSTNDSDSELRRSPCSLECRSSPRHSDAGSAEEVYPVDGQRQIFQPSPSLSDSDAADDTSCAGSKDAKSVFKFHPGQFFHSPPSPSDSNPTDATSCAGSKDIQSAFKFPPGLECSPGSQCADPGPPPGLSPSIVMPPPPGLGSPSGVESPEQAVEMPPWRKHLLPPWRKHLLPEASLGCASPPPPGLEAVPWPKPLPPWRQRKAVVAKLV